MILSAFAASSAANVFAGERRAFAADGDLHVIADLAAKPEAADEFRRLLTEFAAKARQEPGCKHYSLLEDPAKPGQIYTFEIWADKGALDAHMKTPDIMALIPKLNAMWAKPPVITPLKLLSES
jgi:quinol monooxygenase YgiN